MPTRKTFILRRLISKGCLMMPGAFNAGIARMIQKAGFSAVYISGAGLANATAGVPDIGLLDLSEVARLAGYIAAAVKVPALLDADSGFGGTHNVARAVREVERAGIAGLHLEDQSFPKRCGHLPGKSLVSIEEAADRIRAAVKARRDKDFLIIARTDARGVEGFDAALQRARAYLKAGADGIFPEALETAAEFRRFAHEIRAPLLANMTEFGRGPLLSARQLAAMGYRMVIFPQSAFRVSMHATGEFLDDLKKRGTQKPWLERMQSRQELYQLMGYDPKEEWRGNGEG